MRHVLHGPMSGVIRNSLLFDESDAVLAFWDGMSPGTANMIKLARKSRKPWHIYYMGTEKKDKVVSEERSKQ